jgi:SAM-dependent methyltransferase
MARKGFSMERKETFDINAEQYEKSRPKYHKSILNIISSIISINSSTQILEIGCGTGQATELFANTNARIHSVDIGQNLIDICKTKFQNYPNIDFEVAHYENYKTVDRYDLIFSATAYHWIKQPEGDILTLNLLSDKGVFAFFRNYHFNQYDGFFIESQPIYEKYMGKIEKAENENYSRLNTDLFRKICEYSYFWSENYSIENYIKLISTYSDHISLEEKNRNSLFSELRDLAERKYDGEIKKDYQLRLEIGMKK